MTRLSFEAFSHSKGLGAKWHVCLLGFFAATGFRLPKGSLECSPNSSSHWSHSLLRFFGQMVNYSVHLSPKWLLLHESSLEGSANCALHLSPGLLLESKLCEVLTCLTHTNPVRRKQPIMSLLLGYSLGLYIFFGAGTHTSKCHHFGMIQLKQPMRWSSFRLQVIGWSVLVASGHN